MTNERKDGDNSQKGSWRHALWVFCKAQISAYLATLADFMMTIFLAKFLNVYYLYATFLGSVFGGVVNCVVNYSWVFHAQGLKKKHVALKYIVVWLISILLNTWGTFGITEWLKSMRWLNNLLGSLVDDVFILVKVAVAVMVSIFWNYQMQRAFVYKQRNINKAIRHLFNRKKGEEENEL